jgi:hypothetical protein
MEPNTGFNARPGGLSDGSYHDKYLEITDGNMTAKNTVVVPIDTGTAPMDRLSLERLSTTRPY